MRVGAFRHGPLFQRIAAYQRVSDTEVRCRIAPPDAQPALPLSHSAFIDTCFQSLGVCRGRPESAYAPVALESIRIDPDARWSSALTCRAVLRESSDTMLVGDVLVGRVRPGRCHTAWRDLRAPVGERRRAP